jgi:hypothetical protein
MMEHSTCWVCMYVCVYIYIYIYIYAKFSIEIRDMIELYTYNICVHASCCRAMPDIET